MDEPVITRSPDVMGGTPVFVGTRVPVQTLLDYLEAGDSINDFLSGFPTVSREAGHPIPGAGQGPAGRHGKVRVLVDECVDWRFARDIVGHEVQTARRIGWATLKNGELLTLAASAFDVCVTVDR